MEKQINELSEKFYNIIDNTDNLNKHILMTSYKTITNFLSLNKNSKYEGTLIELLKTYENKAYISKEKFLTDKQIIKLEIQRIKLEYEKQLKTSKVNDIELFEESNIELKRHLLILVEYYLGQLKYFKELDILSQKDIDFIKKRIAYIEILLNMKNGLYYETFLCFAEELERIEKLNQNNKIKSQKY